MPWVIDRPRATLEPRTGRSGGYPAGSNEPIRMRPKQARELLGTKMRMRANVGVPVGRPPTCTTEMLPGRPEPVGSTRSGLIGYPTPRSTEAPRAIVGERTLIEKYPSV